MRVLSIAGASAFVFAILIAMLPTRIQAQPRTDRPACFSTTDEYISRNLVINVLPSSPVLIQRLQGPELRIYCVSFSEAGPQCAATNSVPTLCSRRVDQPAAAFDCNELTDYAGNPNANIVRGDINGPEMIWDIMWTVSGKTPDCFPRSVEVRLLAFVRGSKVSSDAVFGILLAVVIITAILVMLAFLWFLRTRLQVVDKQGAITEAGPKADFRGPQMAMTAPAAIANAESKVYLPVREGAATNDMQSSRYGNMSTAVGGGTPGSGLRRGPGEAMRSSRRSPPRPGEGAPGGSAAFTGAQRRILGIDGEEVYEGGYEGDDWSPGRRGGGGGSSVRRRRGKVTDEERERLNGRSGGGLFPQQWQRTNREEDEHLYFDEQGNVIDPKRSLGATGAGLQSPFGPDGQRTQGVKYIPQWMMGSFGKGGVIPETGDGRNDERYSRNGNGSDSDATGTKYTGRRGGPLESQAFGVYDRKTGLRERRNTNTNASDSEGAGGGSRRTTPRKRAPGHSPLGSPERRLRDSRRSSLKGRRGGGGGSDMENIDDAYTGPRGRDGRPTSPGRRTPTGRGFRGESDAVQDNFSRGSAKIFNQHLQMENDDVNRRNNNGKNDPFDADKENTDGRVPYQKSHGPSAAQCTDCKMVLGLNTTPTFCQATGQRHQ